MCSLEDLQFGTQKSLRTQRAPTGKNTVRSKVRLTPCQTMLHKSCQVLTSSSFAHQRTQRMRFSSRLHRILREALSLAQFLGRVHLIGRRVIYLENKPLKGLSTPSLFTSLRRTNLPRSKSTTLSPAKNDRLKNKCKNQASSAGGITVNTPSARTITGRWLC